MLKIKRFALSLTSLAVFFNAFAQSSDTVSKSMETVVVTGQYVPQSLKKSVYKVRVIDQQTIKLRGAADIAGVLSNEVGIRFNTDFAVGESDISIMGMNGQDVKILLDGVPLVDRGNTKQSLSQININNVDRIEIVEGPMSVVYGTDALAGVINIITKKSNGRSNLSINARALEETTGNTYYPFVNEGTHNEHLGIDWSKGRWNASAYGSRNVFGGYADSVAYPVQQWKPKDQWLTGASLGYRYKGFNAWYRLDYLNEEITALGKINPNTYKGLDQYFITDRFTHILQADWKLSNRSTLNVALSYQDYKRSTETYFYNYKTGTQEATDPTLAGNEGQWDVVPFKNFFARSTWQWVASNKLSLQPGVEIKTDKTSGGRVDGDPRINDYSVFASAEYRPFTALVLRPGVRFTKNSVYDAPPVIPSINTKIILNKDLDLRLSYARGFRAPVLRELYFLFKDANHDIIGNQNLKAEYSNSYQGSLSWQPSSKNDLRFNSILTGFYNDFHNRIDLAQIPGASTAIAYSYFNIENYKTTGVSLENKLSYKELSATVNATYIGRYNSFSDDAVFKANDLPEFVWSPEVSTNLTYNFSKIGLQAGLFYKYTGALPTYSLAWNTRTAKEEPALAKVESYHWADVTLSKSLLRYFTIEAGVKNLFDVTRLQNSTQTEGSIHNSAGPVLTGYGRSYFLGVNVQWNK